LSSHPEIGAPTTPAIDVAVMNFAIAPARCRDGNQ
jgi:hypothetical protein